MTFLGLTDVLAHTRIQRQIDPETGITIYSFNPSPGQRRENREKPVPPPVPQAAPDTTPLRTTVPAVKPAETRIVSPIRLTPSSYRDFPRVSVDTQRERDSERRRILQQELVWEEEKLAQAIENKAGGDVVQRFRTNIEALQREIRNAQ